MENNNKNIIKWTNAYEKAMPPKDSGFILIKGSRLAYLKEDYCANEDSYHLDVEIDIKFYSIERVHCYFPDTLYSLDRATIYGASFACCSAADKHKDFKMKLHSIKIQEILKKIVKDSDWNWKLTDISEWLSIDRDGVYNHLYDLE